MSEPLNEDVERKIIEEGGMSKEDYEQTIDELEQAQLQMGVFRNIAMLASKQPPDIRQGKAINIQKVRTSTKHLTCYEKVY